MSFKENLLKKIEIEMLSAKVISTFGAPDSGAKIDRESIHKLLDMTDFAVQRERDLELYIKESEDEKPYVLVLDNELALYRTTVSDVALRKSPTLKEMISIRNAIKILNDKDVVLAKRADTVNLLKHDLIDKLDLSFTAEDVSKIVEDGAASLEKAYGPGVEESLVLLAEIMGYRKAPKVLTVNHHLILGSDAKRQGFGPLVAYNRMHNKLRWIERCVNTSDKAQVVEFRQELSSEAPSDKMGEEVFMHLATLVEPGTVVYRR